MAIITLKEAIKRSKLDLISDLKVCHYDRNLIPISVRFSQKETEKRYPAHKFIRECSIKYFLNKGYDVYPNGIAIRNIMSCPDFAFFSKKKIIFVECSTEHRVYSEIHQKKRLVEEYAPIIFIVEDPSIAHYRKSYHKRDYIERINRLAKECKVFCCNYEIGRMKKFNLS